MNRAEYSVGFRFAETINIPSTDIKSFASLVGDINPIHHDLSEATRRGHDGLIACGPHIASLLAALLTRQFSPLDPMLGLAFNARFTHPYRDGPACFAWTVKSRRESLKNHGWILRLKGEILQNELTVMQAMSTVLILGKSVATNAPSSRLLDISM